VPVVQVLSSGGESSLHAVPDPHPSACSLASAVCARGVRMQISFSKVAPLLVNCHEKEGSSVFQSLVSL